MIITFHDVTSPGEAHAQFQAWRARHPDGYVLNVKSASDVMLHTATCAL